MADNIKKIEFKPLSPDNSNSSNKISFDVNKFVVNVYFNNNKQREFVGEILKGEECKIILPSFTYYNESKRVDEIVNKEQVMKKNFFEKND